MGRRSLTALVAFAFVLVGVPMGAQPAAAVSPNVVISQVYGGGGNTGATVKNDFIELFNLGPAAVNVTGWSVQYASSTGSSWQKTDLTGWIKPGRYYLIQEAAGSGGTLSLPTPHAIGTGTGIAMAAGAGKVVLLNTNAPITGGALCPTGASVVDIVGYGVGTTTCSETAPTPNLTNTTAAIRKSAGAQDTDNNNSDFVIGAPTFRAAADYADYPLRVVSTTPSGANVPLNTNIGITFSEPVFHSGTWFTISCATTGSHTAAEAGGPTTFALDPDTDFVGNETCTVTVVGSRVVDQDSDDPPDELGADYVFTFTTLTPPVKIREIQDSSHTSPKSGQIVGGVAGIVTGKTSNGFWMQDPAPDTDPATSEGIFVFTSSSAVAVGDAITVTGRVTEFRPGPSGLSITELTSPTIAVSSSGNALPAAIKIGTDRTPPTEVIEDDATGDVETSGIFDPASDGIDFWESLEGMRVDLGFVVVTGPSAFDELGVLANNGAGATSRTARGGILITGGDKNPEKILMRGVGFNMPDSNTGDHFAAPIVGIVGYDFGNFMLEVLAPPTRVADGVTRETATAPGPHELTVATFNVENLDPGDASFPAMADLIVHHLLSPDVISLEEIQDNDGEANTHGVDATATLTKLRDAVIAAGGPTYAWRQIDPVDLQDGGAPGGNIRQAFFFRTDRGVAFVDRPGAGSTTANSVVDAGGVAQLQYSPGRIDPTNSAFNSSRKPLAGEFTFNGHRLILIANHWNSKGGDDPLWGRDQPPVLTSEVQRRAQATIVRDFVQDVFAVDANAEVVVLGDLNDFEFSNPLLILKSAPMNDLIETLPANERYTYVFEGNSQTLDHILVSDSLLGVSRTDVVHVNSEFWDQASDHEPQVATLNLAAAVMFASRMPAANANGWNNANVTVIFDCTTGDPLDIIVSCPSDVVLSTDGADQSVTRTATTKGGSTVTSTVDGISIDKTLPVITFTGATTYTIDQTVSITCSVTDALSGLVAGSTCETASGPAYLLGVGAHTLAASGTDKAGNVATASLTYSIAATDETLCALTTRLVTKDGIGKSLCSKLEAAAAAGARGNTIARDNQLNAYRNEVEAQRGKAISDANAAALISLAGLL
jgi:predicted extracellular nuclease